MPLTNGTRKATKNNLAGYDLAVFRKKVFSWYKENGRNFPWRRKSAGLYEKIISEVLLQRTRAETVASFLPKFITQFPS